ncbi:MAG: hypothetical protein IKW99_03525 [Bacteroidales bacterium]|nr:hypothetical protein [Bacteroidales bacterium]
MDYERGHLLGQGLGLADSPPLRYVEVEDQLRRQLHRVVPLPGVPAPEEPVASADEPSDTLAYAPVDEGQFLASGLGPVSRLNVRYLGHLVVRDAPDLADQLFRV